MKRIANARPQATPRQSVFKSALASYPIRVIRSQPARTALCAIGLAALLTLVWAARDWANLAQLRLPDTDDAMRLQQVRDWLAGQRWGDVGQHRLANGVPMHWSRLADLGPAALVTAFTPLIGRPAAELLTVLIWPGLLFAVALWLTARIGRAMQVPPITAMLVAALAFPASALFLPGRIDHHGVQLVLLLALVRAMLFPRGERSGAGIALAAVASLVIGLEMAPFAMLAWLLVALGWIAERPGAGRQLAALGAALFASALAAAVVFANDGFALPLCDGFTRPVWHALLIAAAALLLLAASGRIVAGRGPRLLVAVGLGGLSALLALRAAPACAAPYGGVDPMLAARWLARVGEAQPLFAAALPTALGQAGLMIAGLAAGAAALRRTRDPGWAILLLFQGCAAAITLWQLRGAAAGALLTAPALGWLIAAARRRGTLALAGAWLASAGIVYPLAAQRLPARPDSVPVDCASPAALASLAALPAGRVAAPIDVGAWGIAATPHSFLGGPYHRNNAGNRAAFAILDGPAGRALPVAAAWRVDYLFACDATRGWWHGRLRPIARGGGATIYAFPRLSDPRPRP